jgi:phosphate-selective porin OprO/OprP
MSSRHWKSGIVLATALGASPAAFAEETSNSQVQAELAALREKVAVLEAKQGETWLTERRAEEVKALVRDVLSDADTRASLAEGGVTAGHNGKNFFLASEDGTFLLNVGGQFQFRYTANGRSNQGLNHAAGNDNFEGGFNIRRTKLDFNGFIGSPKTEFRVLLDANRDTGGVDVQEAWIAYNVLDNLKLTAGRFPDRYSREQMISSKYTLAADRSAVANIFAANDGVVEGVAADWNATDALKISVTLNDGLNSGTQAGAATGFQNGGNDFNNDATDIAVTARADYLLAGKWADTTDLATWSNTPLTAVIGGAVHYEVAESGDHQASGTTAQTGPYDSFVEWTVDGLVKAEGFTFLGAVYGWHFDGTGGNANANSDTYAAVAQLGYAVIPDKFLPFVRYEYINVDNNLTAENNLNILTAGANYYFKKHNLKVTADVVWALNNVNANNTLGIGLGGIGLLTDSAGKENQTVGRVQIQLLF